MDMASPQGTSLSASPPADTHAGPGDSLLLVMTELTESPSAGRLLRGLTPYLDESGARNVFLLTGRSRREHWRAESPLVNYQELIHWARDGEGGSYRGVAAKDNRLQLESVLEQYRRDPLSLIDWAADEAGAAVVTTAAPLRLGLLQLEKPWGREGWYTGVEQRGVCSIISPGGSTEIPYALGLFPVPMLGESEPGLILLKTLEPRPEEVLGDLYLEVHEEKWETYLVLEVNREAWPDGTGYLRVGLDKQKVAEYRKIHGKGWEAVLTAELGKRIARYEKVRRKIDELPELEPEKPSASAGKSKKPASAEKAEAAVPKRLLSSERRLRGEVEALLGRYPLGEGDVACLPPGVLHSLQHGVKVVEFQTPSYERLIAMFAQKVLTQPQWDTAAALELMEKRPYRPPPLVELPVEQEGVTCHLAVDFPQFSVVRYRLEGKVERKLHLEAPGVYRLLFITKGEGWLTLPDGERDHGEPDHGERDHGEPDHGERDQSGRGNGGRMPLAREEGLLLPALLRDFTISSERGITYLIAFPKSESAAKEAL